jgi:hypothetical protein
MRARVPIVTIWLVLAVILGCLACALLVPPGPVARDTPFMREYSRIHQICSKLALYAREHPDSTGGRLLPMTADELAAAGILSAEDVSFVRDHYIEFRGFDPSRIGGDVPVLEELFTNTSAPRRIVGYSDGSTVAYDLHKAR